MVMRGEEYKRTSASSESGGGTRESGVRSVECVRTGKLLVSAPGFCNPSQDLTAAGQCHRPDFVFAVSGKRQKMAFVSHLQIQYHPALTYHFSARIRFSLYALCCTSVGDMTVRLNNQ